MKRAPEPETVAKATSDEAEIVAVPVSPPLPGSSQHCAILAVEVADDRERDDGVRLAIREALYRLLIAAFDTSGIGWERCLHEDRGNGVLVVIPLHMPTAVVIDPLFSHLRDGVRRHNRLSSDAARIRLRAAVHVGEVHRDQHGVAGAAVDHLLRLLDAPAFKEALASSGWELAGIVSDYLYDSVIRHAPEITDQNLFWPVVATLKETRPRTRTQVRHRVGPVSASLGEDHYERGPRPHHADRRGRYGRRSTADARATGHGR